MIGDPWAEAEGQAPTGVLLQNLVVVGTDGSNQPFVGGLVDASAAGLMSAVFYKYELDITAKPNVYDYQPVDGFTTGSKIQPYVGYWVHAYGECQLRVPPP